MRFQAPERLSEQMALCPGPYVPVPDFRLYASVRNPEMAAGAVNNPYPATTADQLLRSSGVEECI